MVAFCCRNSVSMLGAFAELFSAAIPPWLRGLQAAAWSRCALRCWHSASAKLVLENGAVSQKARE